MRLLLALVANILGLLATTIVPGISWNGNIVTLVIAGIVFGLFNAIVRPIVLFLSIPFLIVTLGLFYFIVNGMLLIMASWLMPGYRVDGLVAGILGGLVLTVLNWILDALFKKDEVRT